MNKKPSLLRARLEKLPFFGRIVRICAACYRKISHNFGLKLLSLLMAILLWNYVVTNEATVMRTKTISGVTATVNRDLLTRLSLPDDPTPKLQDISVMIEVKQTEFAYVNANNVQVSVDLSRVTDYGTQSVPLKATTSYGRVTEIIPDSVTLTFERNDSRNLPISFSFSGDMDEDYWYNVAYTNPATLEIRGATTPVRSIRRVVVDIDVSEITETQNFTAAYDLLTSDDDLVDQTMLDLSTSSVMLRLEVYPRRELPIDNSIAKVTTGEPAKGYKIESITIQPPSLLVAAEEELLDSIEELYVEPINVEGATQSLSQKANVAALSSFRNVSAEDVYVSINIVEETVTRQIENVELSFVNKDPALNVERDSTPLRVSVTGPHSVVERITEKGITAVVDLKGKKAGENTAPLDFSLNAYEGVTYTPESDTLRFTLTPIQNTTVSEEEG